MKLSRTLLTAGVLIVARRAHARYLCLEQASNGAANAYFGEWADDIGEKAGGPLDRINAPRAFLGDNNSLLSVKRHEERIEIAAKDGGDLRMVEDGMAPARG